MVGCRLVLLMDDLLWVLTDSQLTAAFHFVDSLSDLIKLATQQSQKTKAVRKLEVSLKFLTCSVLSLLWIYINDKSTVNDNVCSCLKTRLNIHSDRKFFIVIIRLSLHNK